MGNGEHQSPTYRRSSSSQNRWISQRATWIEVRMHHSMDCENIMILITTNQDKRIEETVEIEIGNYIHLIRVLEINISDDVGTSNQWGIIQKLKGGSNDHKEEFHMSSTEEDNSGASSAKVEKTEEDPSRTDGYCESIKRSKSDDMIGLAGLDSRWVEEVIGSEDGLSTENLRFKNRSKSGGETVILLMLMLKELKDQWGSIDSPTTNEVLNHLRNLKEVASENLFLVAGLVEPKDKLEGQVENQKELEFSVEMLLSHECEDETLDDSDFCHPFSKLGSNFANDALFF
ncbi:hypothetical protein F3Y22_tig00113725pilonHSYRG01913 [Hibiscus syriacus]|uniref:Uncharacterized protein n=1 Tax=Hibiscus syriacus TaxID=106335 RepID=A0A6A2WMV7_HIBSY|nr:hypothetical protein F3Y22_tig00113725pilonHSYRG01913 [Hibiscus syriacus]